MAKNVTNDVMSVKLKEHDLIDSLEFVKQWKNIKTYIE